VSVTASFCYKRDAIDFMPFKYQKEAFSDRNRLKGERQRPFPTKTSSVWDSERKTIN